MDRDTYLVVMVIACGLIATLSMMLFSEPDPQAVNRKQTMERSAWRDSTPSLPDERDVQLVTGDEPIQELLVKAGCAVCHSIPGVPAAKGRQGPRLVLGETGPRRLSDPNYHGSATTVREYIMESILTPDAYIVPGYPEHVMPRWYGRKLNATALNRIVRYLETLTSFE
ncbi:MAG: hypothetical protein D6690_09715 [Nitrospirae bacterium]|nr:MAG: hypothetical protein D6690_09715 [Nitrospirota bacterium]